MTDWLLAHALVVQLVAFGLLVLLIARLGRPKRGRPQPDAQDLPPMSADWRRQRHLHREQR